MKLLKILAQIDFTPLIPTIKALVLTALGLFILLTLAFIGFITIVKYLIF